MDDDIAVRVEQVSKIYRLWRNPTDSLFFSLRRFLACLGSGRGDKESNAISNQEFYALDNLSFTIKKGESWGIIGVNGSGKSTLLKIISGNLRPSTGFVDVDGKVAILDYNGGFNEELSGKETIFLKATLQGLSKKQINERYDSIVDFAELGDFIHQAVKTYSTGMRARLGFAIMAHVDTDIFIADEALAVGDVFFVHKCMRFIRSFLKRGTFLFVSHATNDILSLCQKAIWLEQGCIKAIGLAPTVVQAYLDAQTINTMNGLRDAQPVCPSPPALKEIIVSELCLEQPRLSELMNYSTPNQQSQRLMHTTNKSFAPNEIHIETHSSNNGLCLATGACILGVELFDEEGSAVSCVHGGDIVTLSITLLAEQDLLGPIVGFQVMDSSGQVLFADNSSLLAKEQSTLVKANTQFAAEFTFQMPLLPVGEYPLRAAVALGEDETQAIMLQLIDKALIFRSVTSGINHGLIGMPMLSIELTHEAS